MNAVDKQANFVTRAGSMLRIKVSTRLRDKYLWFKHYPYRNVFKESRRSHS
jgi:hypothetical protein